ncbi:MAG: hypothetical protein PHD00_02240 [Bacteroidales bacterium]|nr:hypothetical protein [Bacteroidales bacterium]MDD4671471.1 hypothetical protein [Bacteroidales bacterium]MDY0347903.1 hypothetical protein [Tenuifilaceae bacterium]
MHHVLAHCSHRHPLSAKIKKTPKINNLNIYEYKKIFILFLTLSTLYSCTDYSSEKYLETVLKNLDKIETASYTEIVEQWHHGDTAAAATYRHLVREYSYSTDTTIGSKFVVLDK